MQEDALCEHGHAFDMHCCACGRSGFLFDSDSCTCSYGDISSEKRAQVLAWRERGSEIGMWLRYISGLVLMWLSWHSTAGLHLAVSWLILLWTIKPARRSLLRYRPERPERSERHDLES